MTKVGGVYIDKGLNVFVINANSTYKFVDNLSSNDIISQVGNDNLEEIFNELKFIFGGVNMDDKKVEKEVLKDTIDYLKEQKENNVKFDSRREVTTDTINYLLGEKEKLNEEVNDIIYSDMGKVLDNKDLEDINYIKSKIDCIYAVIGRIEMFDLEEIMK